MLRSRSLWIEFHWNVKYSCDFVCDSLISVTCIESRPRDQMTISQKYAESIIKNVKKCIIARPTLDEIINWPEFFLVRDIRVGGGWAPKFRCHGPWHGFEKKILPNIFLKNILHQKQRAGQKAKYRERHWRAQVGARPRWRAATQAGSQNGAGVYDFFRNMVFT